MSTEKYYRNLSEIYQIQYNEQIEVAETLMIVQGIAVEMLSDLIQFEQKNGQTEKLKISRDRVKLLLKKILLLSTIQSDNYSLKLINRRLSERIIKLEALLREQDRQDKMIFNFENTEIPTIPSLNQ